MLALYAETRKILMSGIMETTFISGPFFYAPETPPVILMNFMWGWLNCNMRKSRAWWQTCCAVIHYPTWQRWVRRNRNPTLRYWVWMLGYAPFHPTSGNDGFGSWKAKRISASRFVSRLILRTGSFWRCRWGAAIFTFIIIRVNHNYFFIYNVLSLFFFAGVLLSFVKSSFYAVQDAWQKSGIMPKKARGRFWFASSRSSSFWGHFYCKTVASVTWPLHFAKLFR